MSSNENQYLKTQLNKFDNSWFSPGKNNFVCLLWYITNALLFKSSVILPYRCKSFILRLFGAQIGKGVVIKPDVNIKYPWRLYIGDYVWIGEGVWIDNLDEVHIGNHVCLSQGCMLLTGNHNYKLPTFDLFTGKIILEDGVWIGARSVVCPGVTCHSHAVLTVGSVATSNLEPYWIYTGNPATKVRKRI